MIAEAALYLLVGEGNVAVPSKKLPAVAGVFYQPLNTCNWEKLCYNGRRLGWLAQLVRALR